MENIYEILNRIDDDASLNYVHKKSIQEGLFDGGKKAKQAELEFMHKLVPSEEYDSIEAFVRDAASDVNIIVQSHLARVKKSKNASEVWPDFSNNIKKLAASTKKSSFVGFIDSLRHVLDTVDLPEKEMKKLDHIYEIGNSIRSGGYGKQIDKLSQKFMSTAFSNAHNDDLRD